MAFFIGHFAVQAPAEASLANRAYFGGNFLSHGLGSVASDASSQVGVFGTNYFNLVAGLGFQLSDSVTLATELIAMPDFLFPNESPDGATKSSFYILNLPLVYQFSSSWDARFGPALVIHEYKGLGGVATLSNGNSTAQYALPSQTVFAKTIAVDIGAGYSLPAATDLRVAADFLIESIVSSSKLTYSFLFTVTYATLVF